MRTTAFILGICLVISTTSNAQKIKFKKVPAELVMATSCPYDEEAKAELIYHSTLVEYEYDVNNGQFDVAYYVHDRIKIYDAEDTKWADYSISYYKGKDKKSSETIRDLEAYTFYAEGDKVEKIKLSKKNVFDEEVNKFYKVKKFAMPGVKSGVVLDIKYKKVSPYVFNIDEFYFQSSIPTRLAKYEILAPEYYNYNFNAKGSIPLDMQTSTSQDNFNYSYTVDESNDRRSVNRKRKQVSVDFQVNERLYLAKEVPAIKSEPYVYTMSNYKSSMKTELLFTNFPNTPAKYYTKTWVEIGDLLMENSKFGSQVNKKYKMLDDISQLVEGKSPKETIAAIYSEVQSRYTWNEYANQYCEKGIKNLISEGTGNVAEINLLMVNLLRKAGLTAYPMVSRRSTSGFLNIANPSLSELDYVTAAVVLDDQIIHLDATSKYLLPGMLPFRALNLKGVIIDKENSQEVPLNNPNSGGSSRLYDLELQGEELVGAVKGGHNGYSVYKNKSKAETEEKFIKNLSGDDISYSDVELTGYENNKKLKFEGKAIVKNAIQEVDGKIFIDLSAAQGDITNPFIAKERNFALFFDGKSKSTEVLKIKIPEGYTVETLPEKLNAASPEMMVKYLIEVAVTDQFLMITSRSSLNTLIIPPDYYSAIKDLYDLVESKYNEKIH